MATKLTTVDGATKVRGKRSPTKLAILAEVVDLDGTVLSFPQGSRLKVLKVYRNMAEYADAITDDPTNMPLFAKIEVPSQS